MLESYLTNNNLYCRNESEYYRVHFINSVILICIILITILIPVNIFLSKLYLLAGTQAILLFVLFGIAYLFKKSGNTELVASVLLFIFTITLGSFFLILEHRFYALSLVAAFPSIAFFLKGKRAGLISTVTVAIGSFLYMLYNINSWEAVIFSWESIFNIMFTTTFATVVIFYYESSRKKALDMIQLKNEELQRIAFRDFLTALLNRRAFLDLATKEFERSKRSNETFSLLMIDIDNFKTINDTYGHHIGDMVIESLANILKAEIRPSDLASRYGGEEFLVLLVNTDGEAAVNIAERFRKRVEDFAVSFEKSSIFFTVSIGVSSYAPRSQSLDEVVIEADAALYKAKSQGKNCIAII